jgi:hypothetical protein
VAEAILQVQLVEFEVALLAQPRDALVGQKLTGVRTPLDSVGSGSNLRALTDSITGAMSRPKHSSELDW